MIRKFLTLVAAAALVCGGCAAKKKQVADGELETEGGSSIALIEKVSSAVSPKLTVSPGLTVAVLPALPNEKVLKDAAEWSEVDPVALFRTVFFGRFSVLPFRDKHIRDVDRALAGSGLSDPGSIASANPSELGKLLGADALVFIDLTKAENVTAGVHSRTEYAATLRMIEVATGQELWRAELNQTSRGGILSRKSSQVADLVEFEKVNKNRPLAFRQVAEVWSYKVIEDFKEKANHVE